MRELIFVALLASFVTGTNYRKATLQAARRHDVRQTDTIFISREKSKDYYHKVYIEKNRLSPFYKDLMDFKMEKFELEAYKQNCLELKKHFPSHLKKYDLTGLPKEWIPLYKYKGKYYIYYPSEEGNMGRRIITDSSMVYWFMDGPDPEPILSAKKINENNWYLDINSYCKNISGLKDRPDAKLTIHIIDPKNKIAVWEDASQPKVDRYELYVPKIYAKNFDMIVNYCLQNKTEEFEFDNIDYPTLLKGY
jgi:hypothetical protein